MYAGYLSVFEHMMVYPSQYSDSEIYNYLIKFNTSVLDELDIQVDNWHVPYTSCSYRIVRDRLIAYIATQQTIHNLVALDNCEVAL